MTVNLPLLYPGSWRWGRTPHAASHSGAPGRRHDLPCRLPRPAGLPLAATRFRGTTDIHLTGAPLALLLSPQRKGRTLTKSNGSLKTFVIYPESTSVYMDMSLHTSNWTPLTDCLKGIPVASGVSGNGMPTPLPPSSRPSGSSRGARGGNSGGRGSSSGEPPTPP